METKLTIQERLKDLLVVERGLSLEQTGLSKSALGKYESEDFKDISPFAIVTLAKFYGVSADYLLGLTENKNPANAELQALHLRDDAVGSGDPYMRTLELGQIQTEEYFARVLSDDLVKILDDIREVHRKDATTADGDSAAEVVSEYLQTAMSFEGSPQEKQARVYLAGLGVDYNAISKEKFVTLMGILRKSKRLQMRQGSQRGKGKRKR